jgi:FdhE protein
MNPELLRLPRPASVFAARAARFRALSAERPALAGYLALLAEVAELQHRLAEGFPAPSAAAAVRGPAPEEEGFRPLPPAWREGLHALCAGLGSRPEPLGGLLARLRDAPVELAGAWAGAVLAGEFERVDSGLAPFVAAALQLPLTARAGALDPAAVPEPATPWLCPVCGGLPVAGVLQAGGAVPGLRHLCCSLCASAWHRVRSQCVQCGSAGDVAYFAVEGAPAVRAEACGGCRTYIKIMDVEKEPRLDPFADDIASLGLDLLLAEEGYRRLGCNPFLVPGE